MDPRAKTVLAPEDRGLISLGGSIVVLDCSWKHIESLDLINGRTRLEGEDSAVAAAAESSFLGQGGEALVCRGSWSLISHFRTMGSKLGLFWNRSLSEVNSWI